MPNLTCERLEPRDVPSVTAALAGGTLNVLGTEGNDRIRVIRDGGDLVVLDGTAEAGRFASGAVTAVILDSRGGNDSVIIGSTVEQPVEMAGGDGTNKLVAGGGATSFTGGPGTDTLFGGSVANAFNGGGGNNRIYKALPTDVVIPNPGDQVLKENLAAFEPAQQETLTTSEVETLLNRAAAASASSDGIIVVTDRLGRILGVRVESGVDPGIRNNDAALVFAIDGAVAKARTGALFGNNQAPLTSRTVQFISQSTITEREVNSNPNITDPNSTVRGPGFVAAVGIKSHFPPGIALTPQVDLFQIEHTNRDGTFSPGADKIKGTADDQKRDQRFDADPAYIPAGQELSPMDSYGFESKLLSGAQSRGIGTLPGGIPIFKNGQSVGGIGVFYPGKTGYATEENSALSTTYDPSKPDRSLEAEWVAFAAVGGYAGEAPVGTLGGVAALPGFGLPFGRIDLVGITLDIVGPGGPQNGLQVIQREGQVVGRGSANDGANQPVTAGADSSPRTADDVFVRNGKPVPEGWLVLPHDGDGVSKVDVERIVAQGLVAATQTRAAIRLPLGSRTRMVFAVSDLQGRVVGLYRMPDATTFSIDVAVAKARNVAYYADPNKLQPIDQVPGVPAGTALTNRTFRFLGLPFFPEGIDGTLPGPFSQLNDGGADPTTGLQVGAPLPASAYQSAVGYDAFNPGTNFHDPTNLRRQNGIVFFPGSAPIYRVGASGRAELAGGFGVSGDGVDQDDVVTTGGQDGFTVPDTILRADQTFVRGVRLPYQKFNRNPYG